jgi:hypothetical protein
MIKRGVKFMFRREFFGGAAAGVLAAAAPAVLSRPKVDALAREIETAIMAEVPGITRVQVTYDPENEKVPLMILAFRV